MAGVGACQFFVVSSRALCVCEVSFGSLAVGVPLDYRVWLFVPNLNLRLILNLSTNTINTKLIYSYFYL